MNRDSPLTAEEFVVQRDELPDGGRWTELHAGEVVHLAPPDAEHGNVVLNLTKALAAAAQPEHSGYPCFELGLIVERNPDSVWCPAVSYFTGGRAFAEADNVITETRPALVVEVASSNDRRKRLADRISRWLQWGVSAIWVLDTVDKLVHVVAPPRSPRQLRKDDPLEGGEIIPGFRVPAAELFAPPSWWK
jgi:Uma2 family endonuclease